MTRLRMLTYNVLGCRGYRREENPVTNPGPPRPHLIAEMAEYLRPLDCDIIALQEAPVRADLKRLAKLLNRELVSFSSGWPGNRHWPGGFPGALLLRSAPTVTYDLRSELGEVPAGCFHRISAPRRC